MDIENTNSLTNTLTYWSIHSYSIANSPRALLIFKHWKGGSYFFAAKFY